MACKQTCSAQRALLEESAAGRERLNLLRSSASSGRVRPSSIGGHRLPPDKVTEIVAERGSSALIKTGCFVPLPDKRSSISEAISLIGDDASVMLGGFGVSGTPFCLIRELVRRGPRNLTLIQNDANEAGMGVDWLLENGQVAKLVTTHIGRNSTATRMMNDGMIEVEFVPEGIMAERIRVAGAGVMGFISGIGLGAAVAGVSSASK